MLLPVCFDIHPTRLTCDLPPSPLTLIPLSCVSELRYKHKGQQVSSQRALNICRPIPPRAAAKLVSGRSEKKNSRTIVSTILPYRISQP